MGRSSEPVSIPDTESRTVASRHVADEFQIHIALPHAYESLAEPLPVLYLLDGNGLFGMTTETLRLLDFFGGMRQLIVVGIGYRAATPFQITMGKRTRDYTPSDEGWYRRAYQGGDAAPAYEGEGGGAAFLAFLCEELVPAIESEYRAASDERAICGYSFGGLLALQALFTRPGFFKRYLVCSPSLWWGNGEVSRLEAAYAERATDLPAWLFMATGSEEGTDMTEGMEGLAAGLIRRRYPSLEITATLLAGDDHLAAFPVFLPRALGAAFGRS